MCRDDFLEGKNTHTKSKPICIFLAARALRNANSLHGYWYKTECGHLIDYKIGDRLTLETAPYVEEQ